MRSSIKVCRETVWIVHANRSKEEWHLLVFVGFLWTRTMGFDNALIELIKCVCGNESNNVFRAFTEAQDNKTIIANGHTIRIRPASDSGHSKLIISY